MRENYIRQHYVPQHHLEQFTVDDSTNNVWCFDKVEERTFPVSIANIAVENYFYDGPEDEEAETEIWLQNLEDRISGEDGIYQKILRSSEISPDVLSPKEIMIFGIYVAVQELRTREWRNNIEDTVSQLEGLFGDEATTELQEDMVQFQTDESLREFQSDFLKDNAPRFARIMLDRLAWCVFENRTNQPFWTSDHPVVRFNTRNRERPGSHGLQSEGIEVYFPLSPNYILYLVDKEEYQEELMLMTDEITDPEQVIFFNDLQVQDANRHIFSHTDEFELAERRLDDSPEVGDENRQRANIQSGFPGDQDYS